jgi:hypothetical protein
VAKQVVVGLQLQVILIFSIWKMVHGGSRSTIRTPRPRRGEKPGWRGARGVDGRPGS